MNINNKDIWRDNKKYCIICGKECCDSGVQIMNSFICEECVQEILSEDIGSEHYELVKNKIKEFIVGDIYKIENE